MEGGGMRGLYTAGVIDVLMENDIYADSAVGVSAGAVFGCNYKSEQIGRVRRYNKKYCKDKRLASIRNWITTGDIYSKEFGYNELPWKLDIFDRGTYKDNPMKFTVVCTDINTGKPVYHLCPTGEADDIEWYRASASMPLVSRIVKINGLELLDGGISDSIPIKKFREMGYEKNILILTQHNGYRKTKSSILPLLKMKMGKKYPNLIHDMEIRHNEYNKTLDYIKELEKEGSIYVIRPKNPITIKRTERDPNKLRLLYNVGYKEGLEHIDAMKKFLNQ